MWYVLDIWQPAGGVPDSDTLAAIEARLDALNADIRAAGHWLFNGGLHQPDAYTVVRPDGMVTDGPYVEAAEFVGGFWILDCPDLDAAPGLGPPGRDGDRAARRGQAVRRMIEAVHREHYGRAVAILTRVVGSIELAEDAVQEAFAAAATAWADGPPPGPAGWIVTTARHRAIDALRREPARRAGLPLEPASRFRVRTPPVAASVPDRPGSEPDSGLTMRPNGPAEGSPHG